jgi:hypothetical protein
MKHGGPSIGPHQSQKISLEYGNDGYTFSREYQWINFNGWLKLKPFSNDYFLNWINVTALFSRLNNREQMKKKSASAVRFNCVPWRSGNEHLSHYTTDNVWPAARNHPYLAEALWSCRTAEFYSHPAGVNRNPKFQICETLTEHRGPPCWMTSKVF